ncbi:MAG: hypothetical protein HY870_20960, partial [Chloroflexi bacterium]|nr:hypothetical protein [Chloroflexota bacterium]
MTSSALTIFILFMIAIVIGLVAAFVFLVLRLMRQQPVVLPDRSAPETAPATPAVQTSDRHWTSTREWTSTEYELTRLPLDLRLASFAGAVPHAFDADLLRDLAPGLADRAG